MRARSRAAAALGWTLGLLGSLTGLLVLTVFILWLVLRSAGGQAWLVGQITGALDDPGVRTVSVGSVAGAWPGEIILNDIAVADPEGVWAEAEALSLRWRPQGLLTRTVAVDALALEGVHIRRLPASGPEDDEPEEPFSLPALPDLPVGIRAESITLEARLEEPVLGRAAVLSLTGALVWTDKTAELVLRAGTADAPQTDLALDLAIDGRAKEFDLTLDFKEAEGGLVALIAGLPEDAPLSARLVVAGPPEALESQLAVDLGALGQATGRGTGAWMDDLAIGLGGGITPGIALSDQIRTLTGDTVTYDIALTAGGGQLGFERLLLSGGFGQVHLSGDMRPDRRAAGGAEIDAKLEMVSADGAVLDRLGAGVTAQTLSLTATASGGLTAPEVVADLQAERLAQETRSVERLTAQLGLTPRRRAGRFDVTGRGQLRGVDYGSQELSRLLGGQLTWSAEGRIGGTRPLRLDRLRLDGGNTSLDAKGQFDPETERLEADLALDIGALADSPGLDAMEGSAQLRADLAGTLDRPVLTLMAGTRGLKTGSAAADALLGERFVLNASVRPRDRIDRTAGTAGPLAVSAKAEGAGLNLDASGTVDLETEQLSVSGNLDLPALAPLSGPLGTDLSGRAALAFTADGGFASPAVTADLTLTDALLAGLGVPEGRANAKAFVGDQLSGDLSLSMQTERGVLTGQAKAQQAADGAFQVSGLDIRFAEIALAGDVRAGADGLAAGTLRLDAPSLAALAPFLGGDADGTADPIAGAVQGTVALDAVNGRQAAELTLEGMGLRYGPADAPTASVPVLTVSAALRQDDSGAQAFTASLTGENVTTGETLLGLVELRAEGTPEDVRARLGIGADGTSPRLRLAADIERGTDDIAVTLTELTGVTLCRTVTLQAPARIRQAPDGLTVEGLVLATGAEEVEEFALRSLAFTPAELTAELEARGLPLCLLDTLNPGVTGTVSGRGTLTATAETGAGRFLFFLDDLQLQDDTGEQSRADVSVRGLWDGRSLDFTGDIDSPLLEASELNLTLPMITGGDTPMPRIAEGGTLQGHLSLTGEAGYLVELLPLPTHSFTGGIATEVDVTGDIAAPLLTGSARITGGRYENLQTGTLLVDMDAVLEFASTDFATLTLTAKDGNGGDISADGRVGLAPADKLPITASLKTDGARLIRLDVAEATATSDLQVEGNLEGLDVTGTVKVDRLDASIPEQTPPDIVDLEYQAVNPEAAPPGLVRPENGEQDDAQEEDPTPVNLDIAIDMPRRLNVTGRGLDSEWAGNLKVTGTADAPRLNGAITLQRGEFVFASKTFELTAGRVSFDGGTEIEPAIDVRAEYEADQFTAIIRVSGTPSDLEIELDSTPALPQESILSQILFGRDVSELSPLELARLANAVAAVSGKGFGGSGGGVLGSAREALGLDVLDIETGENGFDDVSLVLGGYLAENIFLGIRQGVNAGSSAVNLEWEVTNAVSLEAEAAQDGDSRVGVTWGWDY